MTIRHPHGFAMGKPAGFDGVFDWDFLDPAWLQEEKPAHLQIKPMDFDAVVERYGRFLIFETKNGEVPIPTGQRITLENILLTADPRRFFIIILRGKDRDSIDGWDLWFKGGSGQLIKEHSPGTADDLIEFCRRWFLWASKQERETFR